MRKDPSNSPTNHDPNRVLIFRLSSLGDVILASAALGGVAPGRTADWVIGHEFEGLLKGHPLLGRVIGFNRREGLRGWVQLCRELWAQGYSEVYDLHRNLRTRVAKALFVWWSFRSGSPRPRWKTIPKSRWKRWGQFAFKAAWPRVLRPGPWVELFSSQIDGNAGHRPDLTHLAVAEGAAGAEALGLGRRQYYCLVPSTRWPAKEWPPERYVELVRSLSSNGRSLTPVILGMPSDAGAQAVAASLLNAGIRHVDALGKLSWPALARVIRDAAAVIGGDTGLMHLAEALGTPAVVLYGPTVPEMGFGPWRKESRSLGADLWCRPCGKDGRFCYRPIRRYECIRGLPSAPVLHSVKESLTYEP